MFHVQILIKIYFNQNFYNYDYTFVRTKYIVIKGIENFKHLILLYCLIIYDYNYITLHIKHQRHITQSEKNLIIM